MQEYLTIFVLAVVLTSGEGNYLKTIKDGTGIGHLKIGVGCDYELYQSQPKVTATQPTSSFEVKHTKAEFLVVHFNTFHLPEQDYIVIKDSKDSTFADFYRGSERSGSFYSKPIYSESITIELYSTSLFAKEAFPQSEKCFGFAIDKYHFAATAVGPSATKRESICGDDNSLNAACYENFPNVFSSSNSVIRLLIHKPIGSAYCTGFLLGCDNHVLTNEHCVASQVDANATTFEIHAQAKNCSTNCNARGSCRGYTITNSASLVAVSKKLDYALLKIATSQNLAQSYGYLQLRAGKVEVNEEIFIPQHPQGWGKRIALLDDSTIGKVLSLRTTTCSGEDIGYNLDTQGGSSGAPVISRYDYKVIALHHCGGCHNSGVPAEKIIDDLTQKRKLPKCAI